MNYYIIKNNGVNGPRALVFESELVIRATHDKGKLIGVFPISAKTYSIAINFTPEATIYDIELNVDNSIRTAKFDYCVTLGKN